MLYQLHSQLTRPSMTRARRQGDLKRVETATSSILPSIFTFNQNHLARRAELFTKRATGSSTQRGSLVSFFRFRRRSFGQSLS